jgi:hypothetical protein
MRTTIVPAQVTTVEDKITGNLSVLQLLLLTLPVFVSGILFITLPPFFGYAVYKIVVLVCFVVMCASLAVRIKGKIILQWLILLLRFNLRPRYYIFDVNDAYLRLDEEAVSTESVAEESKPAPTKEVTLLPVRTADLFEAQNILSNPAARPSFEISKKGVVSVRITEIE